MLSWTQNRVHPLLKAVQEDFTDGEFLALIPRPVGFSDGAAAVTYDLVLEGLVLFRTCCEITNFSTFVSSYSVPTPCHLNAP